MAEEQVGLRKEDPRGLPAWMKLFTAFKVALDPKKLLLAAAGILAMSFGWWLLSALFWSLFGGTRPEWNPEQYTNEKAREDGWKDFKTDRNRWNLRHQMAAPQPASVKEAIRYDAADLAGSPSEYQQIVAAKADIDSKVGKRLLPVAIKSKEDLSEYWLVPPKNLGPDPAKQVTLGIKSDRKDELEKLRKQTAGGTPLHAEEIVPVVRKDGDDKGNLWSIRGIVVEATNPAAWRAFYDSYSNAPSIQDVRRAINEEPPDKRRIYLEALSLVDPAKLRYEPSGQLRTWPWFENRGPNPYLLVTGRATSTGEEGIRSVPWERGQFLSWFASDQVPVLVEPLVKFLRPIVYLFDPASGGWNRIYLFLVILWTLAVWGLFGGAITRMAAVQVARPNEKVGMTEAVRFAWSRYKSFFSAPLFPLLFIVVLTVFLIIFGLFQMLIPIFGDIFVAGLFWPLVLLVGLIMAVVLVGLVGWPLMYSTISAEGSDSFDAISRSYSYVYQAPWHYLWYSVVAMVYGAVLVFFVGLMGSLMVYLGKWGVSQTPDPFDREPTYLFIYAPTSYGWRDLLLFKHPAAETVEVVQGNGTLGSELTLSGTYMRSMNWYNYLGAYLVTIWVWLLFLMVVGFGYSYFWTATTIIYLLMRRKVDDTEMDEVHLEEEEFEEPAPRPAGTAPAAPAGGTAAPGGRTMVEAPTLKAPATAGPPTAPAGAVTATPTPPAAPTPTPKTQLAPEPPSAPKTQLATEPLSGPDGSAMPPAEHKEPPPPAPEGGSPPPDEGKP